MTSDRVIMARAATRAAARGAISTVRALRARPAAPAVRRTITTDGRVVTVEPVTRRRSAAPHGVDAAVVRCAGMPVGEFWTRADPGTSTYEIVPRLDDPEVAAVTLRLVIDDALVATPGVRVAVRRSLDPLVPGPTPELLAGLGLTLVATFPGDAASPRAWAGEQRWELLGG